MIKFQAHRGVSTENPENTMPAFLAAINQGYDVIELDPAITKDQKFVLLHDGAINRTARMADGSEVTEQIPISDITYEQACAYDFGVWFAKKFKGTRIPLLEDVLKLASESGIQIKIDNKYQHFDEESKKAFFALLKPHETVACLTCSTVEEAALAAAYFPRMHIHYDGVVSGEHLEKLSGMICKEQLTVWLPLRNCATSWVKVPFADESLAAMVKEYAGLGLWLLQDYRELETAERLGAELVETNGRLKPEKNRGLNADMHTHSENSHDSVCKIEDMCQVQMEKGTDIMAVTDHCDIFSYCNYDIYTPIKTAYDTVMDLRKKYDGKCRLLAGVEISEGAWFPEETRKIRDLVPYDVVIGSVHCVKHGEITRAYSGIQFTEGIDAAAYFDDYLDEMLAMLDMVDFDVLAHLTCPLRYITGRQKIALDLAPYEEKITEILRRIIKMGIALEVNTSSYSLMNEFMPDRAILQKYYDMGGYLITIGSDAHVTKDAAQYMEVAKAVLKEIGFKHVFFYENRNAYQITI